MAVSYEIPPWLHGANPLQAVESGASLGIRIAESNQRAAIAWAEIQNRQQQLAQTAELEQQKLQQQKELQQQKFAAEQEISQQKQLKDEQQRNITNAYHQSSLDLQKQKFDMTTKTAAEKLAAQQQFILQRETLKSGYINEEGMSPEDAESKATMQALFINGPAMGMSPTSLGAMARQAEGRQGEWKKSPGGSSYYQTPGGPIHFEPKPVPQPIMPEDKADIADMTARLRSLDKQFQEEGDTDKRGKIQDEAIQLAEDRAARIKKSRKQTPSTTQANAPDVATQPQGAPKKGDVIAGYEFQGGDPADQKNWKLPDETDTEE